MPISVGDILTVACTDEATNTWEVDGGGDHTARVTFVTAENIAYAFLIDADNCGADACITADAT
jgi:hypothetical protein